MVLFFTNLTRTPHYPANNRALFHKQHCYADNLSLLNPLFSLIVKFLRNFFQHARTLFQRARVCNGAWPQLCHFCSHHENARVRALSTLQHHLWLVIRKRVSTAPRACKFHSSRSLAPPRTQWICVGLRCAWRATRVCVEFANYIESMHSHTPRKSRPQIDTPQCQTVINQTAVYMRS